MKAIRSLLAAATLTAVMPAAFAASTVDLTITGSLVPAACTPTLSAGEVNFGKFASADLNQDDFTIELGGPRETNLSINCDEPTLYALRSTDNRASTAHPDLSPNAYGYGIGLTPKGEKLGVHMTMIHTTGSNIDGVTPRFTTGNAAGTSWSSSSSMGTSLRKDGLLTGATNVNNSTAGPIAIKAAVFRMVHGIHIAPANALTLTDEVAIAGSAVIEMVYL